MASAGPRARGARSSADHVAELAPSAAAQAPAHAQRARARRAGSGCSRRAGDPACRAAPARWRGSPPGRRGSWPTMRAAARGRAVAAPGGARRRTGVGRARTGPRCAQRDRRRPRAPRPPPPARGPRGPRRPAARAGSCLQRRDIWAVNAWAGVEVAWIAGAFTTLRLRRARSALLCTAVLVPAGCLASRPAVAAMTRRRSAELLDRAFRQVAQQRRHQARRHDPGPRRPAGRAPDSDPGHRPLPVGEGQAAGFDIDLKIAVDGGGAAVDTGRISIGDRSFIKFQGGFYEVPRKQVEEANKTFQGGRERRGSSPGAGVNPRSWIATPRTRARRRSPG